MNWEQFRAILWLRWRLSRNQFLKGSRAGAVIAALVGVFLVTLAVSAGVGSFLLGAFALKKVPDFGLMFIFDGVVMFVLIFTLVAVLTEIQRSESIDLTRLLHLPIRLKQVFVFNYLASLASVGTILALAISLGLSAGLIISRGLYFVLAIPLALAFVFLVTAWVYCLRGWLVTLVVNPRRRRMIIMWISLGIFVVAQTPNLVNLAWQRKMRQERAAARAVQKQQAQSGQTNAVATVPVKPKKEQNEYMLKQAIGVHPWVPLLWLPYGVRGLASGNVLPALGGTLGMFAIGWLGLSWAYRSTLRFYRGDERVKLRPAKPAAATAPEKPVRNWVTARLPWVTEDTAALALAQVRSMSRAPEVRMILAFGLFGALAFLVWIIWSLSGRASPFIAAGPFLATGAVVMVFFTLIQLACNQFGCDREGFRGLVLLPTRRDRILLGKNLALLPIAGALTVIPLIGVTIIAKLSVFVVLATLLQFAMAFGLYCIIGNVASILVPYRVAAGSLKPTKQSWQTAVGGMILVFTFPVVIAPVFIPAGLGWLAERMGWLPAGLVNFFVALLLAVACAAIYWFTLPPLGRMLQKRETHILRAVTEVTE